MGKDKPSLRLRSIQLTAMTQAELMRGFGVDCRQCHTCEAPSMTTPCLKPCPRGLKASASGQHASSEGAARQCVGVVLA